MNTRKHPKQIGVNIDLARRERERKSLKLGKIRRADMISVHRRVMTNDDSELEEDEKGDDIDGHDLSWDPLVQMQARQARKIGEMKIMLNDPDPTVHRVACFYFRKVLAIDKRPPIGAIHNSGVIPRLVELFMTSSPDLQFECAWALTNVACGEKHHVQALIDQGIVPIAIKVMCFSGNEKLRDQALWLISNLASTPEVSRQALLHDGAIPCLLWYMLVSPLKLSRANAPQSMLYQHLVGMERAFEEWLHHQGRNQTNIRPPSLLSMSHVSCLVSCIVRRDLRLPNDNTTILSIVLISPILLYSPDDNVLIATCTALVGIFDGQPALTTASDGGEQPTTSATALQLALERGVLKRLRELCGQSSSDACKQAAISALVAALKVENPLLRLAVLAPCKGSSGMLQLFDWVLQQLQVIERKCDISYSDNEFYLHALNCLSVVLLETSGSTYADQLIRGNLHSLLINILKDNGNFDVLSQAGRTLCCLLQKGSKEALDYIGPLIFPSVVLNLLDTQDLHLLLLASTSTLRCLHLHPTAEYLICCALDDTFCERIQVLSTSIQDEEIRNVASSIVDILDKIRMEENES